MWQARTGTQDTTLSASETTSRQSTAVQPGVNNLPLELADWLPALGAVHAVEVYNHNTAMAGPPDRVHGAYMMDGLLEKKGYRVLVNAGDDAHLEHPAYRFAEAGWRCIASGSIPRLCWRC